MPEIDTTTTLDDPLWDYVLISRLTPYLDAARAWWAKEEELSVQDTGVYPIEDAPPGFMYRFTRAAVKSPISGVQAFPFVLTGYLQISGIKGGSTKMITRVCGKGFQLEEFTIIEKHNLPSTFNQGQFCAFIPTKRFEQIQQDRGAWIYITRKEFKEILEGRTPQTLKNKIMLKM